ncbi:MAG: hypothetical protein M1480_09250 [Bacteroidetes bacterium]|nr:hypothetical protein [Bacteroidota bacterium]
MKSFVSLFALLITITLISLSCSRPSNPVDSTASLSNNNTSQSVLLKDGFDEYGYNYTARLFNGTGESWSLQKGLPADYLGIYSKDKLIMKWSKAWDDARFNGAPWTPDAWEDNEWNGKFPGGSGQVWHYKIIWVGPDLETSQYWRPGGYAIWGEFEVIMDQGQDPNVGPGHLWYAHAKPTGY